MKHITKQKHPATVTITKAQQTKEKRKKEGNLT